MTPDDLRRLDSAAGTAALALARAHHAHARDVLRARVALRRAGVGDALARAALETVHLQRHARARFGPGADAMRFEREALEMASAPAVARYRARRFRGRRRVLDVGCGIGGDLVEIARTCEVVGVERDALRAAMARHNARVVACGDRAPGGTGATARPGGGHDAYVVVADALASPVRADAFDAVWADPARRDARGRRRTRPGSTTPPVHVLLEHLARTTPAGVKLSPAVDPADLPGDVELEWISVGGELRECVLWTGDLGGVPRRATVIERDVDVDAADGPVVHTMVGRPRRDGDVRPVDDWLFVPDPAVVRSGLLLDLAETLGAARIDAHLSWLTAPRPVATPMGRWLRVVETVRWSRRRVEQAVRRIGARRVTVMKRGTDVDVDALARRLTSVAARGRGEPTPRADAAASGTPAGGGHDELVVAIARCDSGRVAILCRRSG